MCTEVFNVPDASGVQCVSGSTEVGLRRLNGNCGWQWMVCGGQVSSARGPKRP